MPEFRRTIYLVLGAGRDGNVSRSASGPNGPDKLEQLEEGKGRAGNRNCVE
jgi:hypothetical protein